MKKGKQSRMLPNRAAVSDLTKSSTILDYAKATPGAAQASPTIIQNLRKPRPRGS